MKHSYRSRDEIKAQILKLALKPTIQHHLYVHLGTTFKLLKSYLEELIECGLLEYHEANRNDKGAKGKYLTTEHGKHWLKKWEELQQLINKTEETKRSLKELQKEGG